MSIKRHIKIGLCLACLVVISGLAGGLLGHRFARVKIEERNNPDNWNHHVSREFDRLVRPTPEQAVRIGAYLNTAVKELQAIRRDTIARSTNVIWQLVGAVEKELTPEQLKAFEVMKPKPSDMTLDLLKVSNEK